MAPSNSDKGWGKFSGILPVVALVISSFALAITGLQWRESHNQLLLSMKPSVDFEGAFDPDNLPVGINIQNAGPGPAIIKSITYYVDKKVVGDMDKLMNFTDLSASAIQLYDLTEDSTLAVGEQHWLLSYKRKPHGKDEEKELEDFTDLIAHHLAVEAEFCPVLPGKCFTKCSTKGWCK
jgi:hypothetical protein